MSVDEIPIVSVITARLRSLLDRSRKRKLVTTIEPPLQVSDLSHDAATIAQPPERNGLPTSTVSPNHAALETAARSIFYEKLAASSIEKPAFVDVWNLLDILQLCADQGQCDPSLALWLLEELLDSQTIDGCRRVLDYLESRRERLITNAFSKNKQMIVLRSCNELLRRLSQAEDAVFCGRVFIFLFQSFPLGDRSSVNLRGEFHIENITTFDEVGTENGKEQDPMDVDVVTKTEITKVKDEHISSEKPEDTQTVHSNLEQTMEGPFDQEIERFTAANLEGVQEGHQAFHASDLYPKFWSMQHIFSNPTKLFDEREFASFKEALDLTIKVFKSVPKVPQTSVGKVGIKRKHGSEDEQLASSFNPKYLTSKDLFVLELSDLTFQRHILVQSLILMDFLLSLTPRAKKKLVELKAQKAMVYNYSLSDEDTRWTTNMRATISAYLQEGLEGKFYYRMVDNVLSRDKNWVRWKVESCPPIEKPPTTIEDYLSAREGAKRASTNKRLRSTPLGSLDLSFLSDTENLNGLDKLRNLERIRAPRTQSLLEDVPRLDQELEKADKAEKAKMVEMRASKTWRALRIATKSRFHVFSQVDEGNTTTLQLLDPDYVAPKPGEEKDIRLNEEVNLETNARKITTEAVMSNEVTAKI